MPDWSYQTVFRPVMRQLGLQTSRSIALRFMGALARLPLGRHVIQLMGHMKPSALLAVDRGRWRFCSPVGLGCMLDPQMIATPAFAEFGLGFLEIGPIVTHWAKCDGRWQIDHAAETLTVDSAAVRLSLDDAVKRLERDRLSRLPVLARLEPETSGEATRMLDQLGPHVRGFVFPADRLELVEAVCRERRQAVDESAIHLACLDEDDPDTTKWFEYVSRAIDERWLDGVIVTTGGAAGGTRRLGKARFAEAVATVGRLRENLGPDPLIIGSTGIHAPADALDYFEAGADLVQVDSGLVFAGPGLPKRINEAMLYRRLMTEQRAANPDQPVASLREASSPTSEPRWGEACWFWALLMGLSMVVGGVMAMIVATTRVVLPYDEALVGLTREQLAAINDRLLSFMTHDRVTLAGTMLAVGILYVTLAWWGMRRGVHWAYVSVVASALAGFLSFFSFLGFGYFDPFHAFVSTILFQFLLLAIHSRLPPRQRMEAPELTNDARWKANQWGQLMYVVHGAVLIVAGLVIATVGMTSVFVPEDLEFMQTSARELYGAHPRLVPLVAHDRATFGGMLIACGVATILPALWGFRRGQRWLWTALLAAGTIAYVATILVHWTVGYHSLKHLLPAYGGLVWLWVGSLASYAYLAARDPMLDAEWERRLERVAR